MSGPPRKLRAARVLVKNSADEERVITNVRPKQERLLGRCAGQRNQHVGNVLFGKTMSFIGDLQPARARKSFEQRAT